MLALESRARLRRDSIYRESDDMTRNQIMHKLATRWPGVVAVQTIRCREMKLYRR